MRTTPADLGRLHKLLLQLEDELETSTATPAAASIQVAPRPEEHTVAVVRALAESGALAALGLQLADGYDRGHAHDQDGRDDDAHVADDDGDDHDRHEHDGDDKEEA